MKYFIYCRKSSEDEERQMPSLDAQLSELDSITREHGLVIADTLLESRSAKGPGRPVFNEMLRRIENGEADAILTWKLDRLARNFDDGGRVIGMLQRGAIREIRTFGRTYLPSDNVLMIAVELGMANQYVRDLSVNIQRGIREKIKRGVLSGKAPLGYFNEPRLRTIEPHPKTFKAIRRIFEGFADGRMTTAGVQRELARAGVVGARSKKPPHLSTVGNMLSNPFYYGVFRQKGELHQGAHVPMISKETFDRVQERLRAATRPRVEKGGDDMPFSGFATCAHCGFGITVERHVKPSGLRFCYYRCSHKNRKQPCGNRAYARKERFEEEVKRNVELVVLPEEWKERFLAKVELWEAEGGTRKQEQVARLTAELTGVKEKLSRINTAFANGALDIMEFKELKNPLVSQKAELEAKLTAAHRTRPERLEPLRNWISEAHALGKTVSEENWSEMKSFLLKVGSNRLLDAQTLTVSFVSPWQALAKTRSAPMGGNGLSHENLNWWRWRELNPLPHW